MDTFLRNRLQVEKKKKKRGRHKTTLRTGIPKVHTQSGRTPCRQDVAKRFKIPWGPSVVHNIRRTSENYVSDYGECRRKETTIRI